MPLVFAAGFAGTLCNSRKQQAQDTYTCITIDACIVYTVCILYIYGTWQVREQNGIPPLVALLEAMDLKVQRAAAGALRTLAFKNEENKAQVSLCG